MQYEKDLEILALKKQARADYRDCANALGTSPTLVSQRCLGFTNWQPGERQRLYRFLQQRVAVVQEAEKTQVRGNFSSIGGVRR